MSKKLLRKKLALMLATLKKKRPYYCEVEHLESTGTQYIDTGYSINTDTDEIIINYTNTSTQNYKWLFGEYETGKNFGITCQDITSPRFAYNGLIAGSTADQYYTVHTLVVNSSGLYNDTIQLSAFKSFASTWNIYLFALNNTGTSVNEYFGYGKIYNYKHKRNGVLVRDFIPVLDWDMTPCMYDKVSGQLFYNEGTGTFTYGREIHYVDYLESTGIEYIDTGITGKTGVKAFIDFEWLNGNIGNDRYVIAASTSSTRTYFGTYQSKWMFGNGPYIQAEGIQENVRYNAEISWLLDNSYVDINGNRIITSTTTGEVNTNLTLWLFSRNQGYFQAGWSSVIKMYSCKIYEVNTLVRDYKPAIDENGVGFMFDRVTHTIFDNAGTGYFKYPARETEYIEVTDLGTNNQNPCLDLGLKYKPSMSIESKYTRTAMGISGSVLPLSNSTTMPLIYMPALNAGAKTDRFVWRRPSLPEVSYYYDFADYPMTVEFKVDAVNDALTVNDNVVKTGMIASMNGYTDPYESNSNLYMLSINGTYGGMGKVYYLKLYDATQVYRDLVPAYKDGNVGMYDKQNGNHYTNNKTGSVTMGKIIESRWF